MSITVSDVSKGFGGRMLFKDVNVTFNRGVNYGLTGPNGAGKSTFMKLLIGAEDTDSGHVSIPARTGWLRQDHSVYDAHRVIDTVIMGNERLWDALVRREALYAKGDDLTDDEGMEIGELECTVAEEDGYTAESDAAILLAGLGIGQEEQERPMSELQGGLKVRVLLAQALFGNPEALLLDEPTNSLDLDSILWLEQFLQKYDGVLVVISHDRRFLNAICDEIADIDFETIILYPGTYDDMVRTKASMQSRREKDQSEREKKISQLNDFIQRFKAGTRSSQTRSRAKQIERLRPDEIKRSNIARPFIRFPEGDPSGRDVLSVRDLSRAFDDNVIFENFHTEVQRGDKVAVLGRNGIGKTTLIKALLDPQNQLEGKVKWGHNTRIGTFMHDHREEIQPGSTVFEWLFAHRPEPGQEHARAILGRMLFSGADGAKPTGTLSGGEAARLSMCFLILMEFNVLILDEPTDHLDLESISALKEAIEAYKGTVIYVTHDRDLASAANRIWSYPEPGKLLDYAGTVDEYLDWYEGNVKK
ncbi:MAG: ABC-F family ATP-binding cassette domain-containing protein [Alphaproteobacteria bacterium]|nr:ABC-F family ATP-binding cassette domain-containing protein [Alphaproteobacteria bacterium]MCB9692710.1 ABC-F family ATP-binding cassette domain-containing protein [Alphaproteobacteria bacterium]